MKFNSIKFEITFLYSLILGIILIIFTGVLYVIISTSLYHELDYNLRWKAEEISSSLRAYLDIQKDKPNALTEALRTTVTEEPKYSKWWWGIGSERRWLRQVQKINTDEVYLNFSDFAGRSLAHSPNMRHDLIALLNRTFHEHKNDSSIRNISYAHQKIRFISFPFIYMNKVKCIVQLGRSPMPIAQLLQNWLYSIVLSIPIILFLTSFVGWLLAKRFLVPVQNVIDAAQKISLENPNERVKEEHYAVEMKSLVEAFNDMIARMEKSFKHIEEFSSHVAHELKTPLTIIRGETELALRDGTDLKECHEVLSITLRELERMLKTIDDLLYLAKIDYQSQIFRLETLDFVELFHEICDQTKILAAPKKIKVYIQCPSERLMIKGDSLHLRRLFFNLIDNALKFTPVGGSLDLKVTRETENIHISIADTGRGISEKNLQKIFEKFFREENTGYGNGLGLSIAQAVVKFHHGTIRVHSKLNQGTVFTVTLPLANPA